MSGFGEVRGISERKAITHAEAKELEKKYGAITWYEWSIANWGTKWNAYDFADDGWQPYDIEVSKLDNAIRFDTAWSPAIPVFVIISEMFPNVEFYAEFADEGRGFLGHVVVKDGAVVEDVSLDWNSEAGVEMRQRLGYWYEEDEQEEKE